MAKNRDIQVIIQDGGLGRLPAGQDYFTGLIFQNASLPAGYGTDNIKRVYSLQGAVDLGITQALFPVEHYHISEYFRILTKYGVNGFLDVGIYNIVSVSFTGAEIIDMQNNAGGLLRQIGIFFQDTYALSLLTACNTAAETLDTDGFPTSIYFVGDVADYTALLDLRTNDLKWVSFLLAQEGEGVGADLYVSEGYSIGAIGAILGITAVASVEQRSGDMSVPLDLSGITELVTLALLDGTLITDVLFTDTVLDTLTNQGYTIIIKRRITGSFVYADCMTASDDASDYIEQRFNRTIAKAKRWLLDAYQVVQNSRVYVDPDSGKMDTFQISYFESLGLEPLGNLAKLGNISYDRNTGSVPRKSIQIDPDQDVLNTGKILVSAKVVPVGAVDEMEISLQLTTSIP